MSDETQAKNNFSVTLSSKDLFSAPRRGYNKH